jgi:hypothetical protein
MGRKGLKRIRYSRKDNVFEIDMLIDLDRFEEQFSRAQFELDSMVMTDMVPYMPMETGMFIQITRSMSAAVAGPGKVVAAAPPMGRYLYEGKTMVDEKTGSPWARKGARKVLVSQYAGKTNAKPNLTYAHGRQSHWFEEAKKQHGGQWIAKTKRTAGGNT